MDAILELRDFGLAYNDRPVLTAINLAVPATGVTVILGPSATGKSSLLRTLAGFNDLHPALRTRGDVIYRHPDNAPHRPALVMQKTALLVSTVLENLVSGLPDRAALTRLAQIERLTAVCAPLGLDWVIARLAWPVVKLDFHEQRAVAIVRETLCGPALLMLDEPTEGLPEDGALALRALIAAVAVQQPVLMVSHNLAEARALADRIVLIAGGEVRESTDAAEFFTAPRSEAGRQFLRTGSCPEDSMEPSPDTEVLPRTGIPAAPAAAQTVSPFRSRFMGPRGFVWLLPGKLAGTPWPGIVRDTDEDLAALRNVGVTRLVSLTETPFDDALAAAYGMRCANLPIPDMHAPAREAALAFCRDLDRWLADGDTVAIHCRAGLGRTGTMLAAYWLWTGQGRHDAVRAIEHIRRMEAGMIQSAAQVAFLSEFADFLHGSPEPFRVPTLAGPGQAPPHPITIPTFPGVSHEQA